MPQFFINRPIFAWVIAIGIIIAGLIAIPQLPVARFPSIAPPSVTITANYPGATPQAMNDSVVALIERELSSVKNLLYFEATTDTSGVATITATFKPGTDPDLAQVDVQNRLKTVEPRLPQTVRQLGVNVEAASSGFLMIVSLTSEGGQLNEVALGDYLGRNITQDLKRIPGVGRVQNFTSERAMRIWTDPAKLVSYGLSMDDVTGAIAAQNVQLAPGSLGGSPAVKGQRVLVPLTADGQLKTPEEFSRIIVKAAPDGSRVMLGDVARIELGSENYAMSTRENGKVTATAAVQLAPGANAVAVAKAVRERMADLEKAMPPGMKWSIPFDTAPFVTISIEKVLHTLLEAMVLVFAVMYLFLQKVRYTLIPAIVAPIALLGTLAVMLLAGFSINVLTMFGMVLAIGIIVDDAIVVVENVERIMHQEHLSPREATRKAMREITGAVIGITAVLTAVFLPMAFSSGSVGAIYRQFTLTMAVSILFSAFLALSLTPALTSTLLKPITGEERKNRFFTWFDDRFERMTAGYERWVVAILKRTGRAMLVFAATVGLVAVAFLNWPTSFLPEEDQGYFITSIQLPADATAERTNDAMRIFEHYAAKRPGIDKNVAIMGFGFSGAGPNMATAFSVLKDWDQRNGVTATSEIEAASAAAKAIPEGEVMSLSPPAIDELGTSGGFSMRLEDRAGQGYDALMAAQEKLLALAAKSKVVTFVYPEGLPAGTNVKLEIDREKAQALGVSFTSISDALSAAMGSAYVNDFPNKGRMQQVIVQAEASSRMQIGDLLRLNLRNADGGMVPLAEVVHPVWEKGPLQMVRYNGYPAVRIAGYPNMGVSSGAAMAEMEKLASQLPKGFSVEWTGVSLQEQQAGSQTVMLLGFSMLIVFLVLAALYESWAIPLSVILVVPLGIIGAFAAVIARMLPSDVFFQVGLITIIGLSAKNAILIVEFAKQYVEEGMSLVDASVAAAKVRLRPILMTSLAFTLGIVPLMIAGGASAATQHAIGTGVFGGMITGTVLAIFLVPVFFVVVLGLARKVGRKTTKADQTHPQEA